MSLQPNEIWHEFIKSKIGLLGLGILGFLFVISIVTAVTIPYDSLKEWHNPNSWIFFPKSSAPAWINFFQSDKIPEHRILDPHMTSQSVGNLSIVTLNYGIDYVYDDFPSDFIYEYSIKYSGSPLLQISVVRPDGLEFDLVSTSIPKSNSFVIYHGNVFSTNDSIKKNLRSHEENFEFSIENNSNENIIFSKNTDNKILKGKYIFQVKFYGVESQNVIEDSKLIIGGKVYGMMGTDGMRRDLIVGLLWGTPIALFIGIATSVASIIIGIVYGVYAGYKGNKTDETMMRFNDVIYALPLLPLLIILAVRVGSSILLIVGFLIFFSWVSTAKISRSMAIQIKTLQYVEAARIMGQKEYKIIFKHIIPQLLPFTFATIAISVPGAIIAEAGLSFLGLGDPTIPTWGQILNDAKINAAMTQGMWWWILPPGIMIAVTGLAFIFIGNAMDKIANPRLKR